MITLIIAGLQLREGRHRETKELLQGHTGCEWWRWDLNSDSLAPEPMLALPLWGPPHRSHSEWAPSQAVSGELLGGDPRLSRASLHAGFPPTGSDGWEHHAAVGPCAASARRSLPPHGPGEGSSDHPDPNPESCSEEPGHGLTKSLHFQETESHTWSRADQPQGGLAFWAERTNPTVLAGVPSGWQITPVIPWQCQLCSPANGARCPPAHGRSAGSFLT